MRAIHFSIAVVALLASCGEAKRPGELLDARWTKPAMANYAALPIAQKTQRSLPELRVYNRDHQLIYRLKNGFKPEAVGAELDRAILANKPVSGPSFQDSVAELETRDGKALTEGAPVDATVFDYWAEWCVPCKVLGKELDAWLAKKTNVRVIRAETDLMAASAAPGEKVIMMKRGPDGKLTKTEKIMGPNGKLIDPEKK